LVNEEGKNKMEGRDAESEKTRSEKIYSQIKIPPSNKTQWNLNTRLSVFIYVVAITHHSSHNGSE
jgi:hypothetical protein